VKRDGRREIYPNPKSFIEVKKRGPTKRKEGEKTHDQKLAKGLIRQMTEVIRSVN